MRWIFLSFPWMWSSLLFQKQWTCVKCGVPEHCLGCLFLLRCALVPGQGCIGLCMIVCSSANLWEGLASSTVGVSAPNWVLGSPAKAQPCLDHPTREHQRPKQASQGSLQSSSLDAWRVSQLSHLLPGGEFCLQHCVFSPLCTPFYRAASILSNFLYLFIKIR